MAEVTDSVLEKRLTEEKRYITKRGDTWVKIAHKVYGHRSWWRKLQRRNIDLSNVAKDKRLAEGVEIWYRAPRIGRVYSVKRNDTFTRILEWKYGATSEWIKVLRINRKKLVRYSNIKPGDSFEFLYSGRVVLSRKGVVVDSRLGHHLEAKVYKSVEGDSLRIIAYRVYGHKTWWRKLVDQNEKLRKYSKYQRLPIGTKMVYMGPVIGSSYKVLQGDTLSRISLWKYGSFKLWDKIAKHNKELLSDPDLIHTGDRIVLKGLGEISIVKKASSNTAKQAPIVLRTPIETKRNLIPKKIELPSPVAKVSKKSSVLMPFLKSLLKFLPIIIFIVVAIIVVFLSVKISRNIIRNRSISSDKKFAQGLSSQKPVSARKSKSGPKLFNKLKGFTDDGEYSHKVGYPELSKRVKFGRLFRAKGNS